MAHIKEPEGVDFIINSRPLTKEDERIISEYIADYKAKDIKKKEAPALEKKTTPRKKHSPQL